MKVKFDGKELEITRFTLFDFGQLEEKGISIQKIRETKTPTAKDLIAIIGYAVRKADSSYKTDEDVAKRIDVSEDSEIMTKMIQAVMPGGKSQVPFTKK